jgi:hypothetical protein
VTAVVAVAVRSAVAAVAAVAAVEKTWWSLLKGERRSCFSFFLSSSLAFSVFSVFQSQSSVDLSFREYGSWR